MLLVSGLFLCTPLYIRRVPTTLDKYCFAFFIYISLNFLFAVAVLGNGINNALADLLPVFEIFFSFQLAKRIQVRKESLRAFVKWLLILCILRAAWQIVAIFVGLHIRPPIYEAGWETPQASIGNFAYDRTIDPISGVIFPFALICLFYKIHRKYALLCLFSTAIVLFLGMTRSEWIACVISISIAGYYVGLFRKIIKFCFLAIFSVGLIFVMFPDLYSTFFDRLITHTVEQVQADDIAVAAVRIAEIQTAMDQFRTSPIFGHGLGSWFGTEVEWAGKPFFVQLHNSYLNLLANTGALGVLLLLLILVKIRGFAKTVLSTADLSGKFLLAVSISVLTWYGIFMIFEPIYSVYHIPVLIGVWWGITAAYAHPLMRVLAQPKRRKGASLLRLVHDGIGREADELFARLHPKHPISPKLSE